MKVGLRYLIPLAAFLALSAFLARGLTRDPHELPSPLVGRQAPLFELPQLKAEQASFTPASMRGQVWLLNVWASWCGACREEHPVLMQMAAANDVPLIGLDYKDAPADARRLLAQAGDPYKLSALDRDGRAGIDYGVYGVPETYLIDRDGIIRFKQVGPLSEALLRDKIMPMVRELRK